MLGKYSTISNKRPATTHIYAMRTYFSPWQTSTANVTKPFLRKPAHPQGPIFNYCHVEFLVGFSLLVLTG